LKLDHAFVSGTLLAAATLVIAPPLVAANGQNGPKSTTAAPVPESQRVRDFADATLDKIVPGHTTKAEVEALLGKPWRETELDEEDVSYPGDPSVEIWEYRGQHARATYRVHIEFDQHDVTTLIAKIPDKAARAEARVANPVPDSAKKP
jgi:outer membrane protein assembly factor BamE (lipoprotein component of BamABCDE complex)